MPCRTQLRPLLVFPARYFLPQRTPLSTTTLDDTLQPPSLFLPRSLSPFWFLSVEFTFFHFSSKLLTHTLTSPFAYKLSCLTYSPGHQYVPPRLTLFSRSLLFVPGYLAVVIFHTPERSDDTSFPFWPFVLFQSRKK